VGGAPGTTRVAPRPRPFIRRGPHTRTVDGDVKEALGTLADLTTDGVVGHEREEEVDDSKGGEGVCVPVEGEEHVLLGEAQLLRGADLGEDLEVLLAQGGALVLLGGEGDAGEGGELEVAGGHDGAGEDAVKVVHGDRHGLLRVQQLVGDLHAGTVWGGEGGGERA
jgi:hypothetical protein